MWLLLLAILLHFHFFFRSHSFRLARARYVMFLLCAFILCSSSWEMARKVSIQQLWYDYAHEIFFWVFIILKAGHFSWFFFHFNYRHSLSQFNQLNYISLWFNQKKQHKRTDMSFLRPTVCQSRIPCDTVFIVVWALVFQFVKTSETIKNVTMDEWMKRVRIWWTVITKHLNIKPNNTVKYKKNRQWNVYS